MCNGCEAGGLPHLRVKSCAKPGDIDSIDWYNQTVKERVMRGMICWIQKRNKDNQQKLRGILKI